MQYTTYIEITETAQGLLSKNCSDDDIQKDKIQVKSLELSKGINDSKSIEKIILEKSLDRSSPLLLNAIDKNESLELKTSLYINGKIAHEFKFKNAFIERIDTKFSDESAPYEKIQIKIA
ncbi:hypothetical protein Xvie_04005 [Xenorhabdus vietnamensis]|uniref:Uncharacterized protein n=1 Tax=Xenorhabdus vietnamensis TaxID=351656 RepID=A0A1Y2S7H1_9GAMM|nr:type VI secretion system tube protein Hcp [Xenorhabdus vietnamensis]OTA14094.1 hypothetical protein Xvie_04005 [Xenorhabdus vietnamensis]UVN17742.1 hypothetical protein pXVIEV2_048 [Xenorhabdus vietnamensis]